VETQNQEISTSERDRVWMELAKYFKLFLQNALNRSINVSLCLYTGLQGKMNK
jgi:hypothetical protein